jgi:hypothetical protein
MIEAGLHSAAFKCWRDNIEYADSIPVDVGSTLFTLTAQVFSVISLFYFLSAWLSVCLPACLSVCLPACLYVCLPACHACHTYRACLPVCSCLSVFTSVCLSVCRPARLRACLCVFLNVICVSIWLSVSLCVLMCLSVCLSVCLFLCLSD